jgi:hypothetical protein
LEKKYPKPNNHPIIKFSQKDFFFLTPINKNNNKGKVMKFNIKKLYGGRLNDVVTPNKNGNKKKYIF